MEDYADENRIYPHQADRVGTSRDIQPWNLEHIIKALFFLSRRDAFCNPSTRIPPQPKLLEKRVWFFPSFFTG
jgi:hypothetical protein